MGDIAAFPAIRNVLFAGNNFDTYTAVTAVKAGQVVGFHGTGVDLGVNPFVTGTQVAIAGVALYDAAAGAQVAVAGEGCIVYVANGLDGTNWDAGTWLEGYGTTTAGTVKAQVVTGGVAVNYKTVGMAIEANTATAAGAYSRVKLSFGPVTPAA